MYKFSISWMMFYMQCKKESNGLRIGIEYVCVLETKIGTKNERGNNWTFCVCVSASNEKKGKFDGIWRVHYISWICQDMWQTTHALINIQTSIYSRDIWPSNRRKKMLLIQFRQTSNWILYTKSIFNSITMMLFLPLFSSCSVPPSDQMSCAFLSANAFIFCGQWYVLFPPL